MPRLKTKIDGKQDFTGGLTLRPQQEMLANELYIAKNVDFSIGGGIASRRAVRPYVNQIPAGMTPGTWLPILINHVHFRDDDKMQQLFAGAVNGGKIAWTDGHVWVDTGATYTKTAFTTPVGAQYGVDSFFQDGVGMKFKWDGHGRLTLGSAFDENIEAPTGTNMPTAKCIAERGDFMWVANTIESDGNHPRRVRWSHPGVPTSWRALDFVEVPRGEITAITTFQDYLVVFTNDEMFGVYGDATENFAVQAISPDTGTPWPYSVTKAPNRLYWWDWDLGMMEFAGNKPQSVFDKLRPGLDQGIWNVGSDFNVHPYVGWGGGRLYAGLPTTSTEQLGAILIYDPLVGVSGAWTTYDGLGRLEGFAVVPVTNKGDVVVTGGVLTDYPIILNDPDQKLDKFGPPGSTNYNSGINIHFATAWFEGSSNVLKKRWRRPRTTWKVGGTQSIAYRWNKDYARKTMADEGLNTDFVDLNFVDPKPIADTSIMKWTSGGDTTARVVSSSTGSGTVTATSGSVTTLTGDWVVVMWGSWDAANAAQVVTHSTTLTGLTIDTTQQQDQSGGGRGASAGTRLYRVTGAGSTGTVTVDIPNADNCSVYVAVVRGVGTRWQVHQDSGDTLDISPNIDITFPLAMTVTGIQFSVISLAEFTPTTVQPEPDSGWTEVFENNGAGYVQAYFIADPTRQQFKSDWTGDDFCWSAMLVEFSSSTANTQTVWNAYDWGGSVLEANHQFVEFETIASPGAANVASLEVKWDATGDNNWEVDLDSIVIPFREKGMR